MFTHLPGTPQESPRVPELPRKFIFLTFFCGIFCPGVAEIQYPLLFGVPAPPPRRAPARLDLVLSPLWSDNQLLGLKTVPETHKAAAPPVEPGAIHAADTARWREPHVASTIVPH